MISITEVMTTPVVTIPPNALVEDALEIMLRHSISGLPVVDEEGKLVGILSEFDTLMLLGDSSDQYSPITPIAHLMTTDVAFIEEHYTIAQVANIFKTHGVRRLPVVRDGKVVGVVSRRDLVRVIRDERKKVSLDLFDAGQESPLRWVKMPQV